MVALWVDHAGAVAAKDQALAHQAGNPGFAGARLSDYQQIAVFGGNGERLAAVERAQNNPRAERWLRWRGRVDGQAADKFGDGRRTIAREDLVRGMLQRQAAPGRSEERRVGKEW